MGRAMRWCARLAPCWAGLLGYAIGMFLMDTIGEAILGFFGYGAGPARRA